MRDVIEEFSLSEGEREELSSSIIDGIIFECEKTWRDSVNRELRSTRNDYLRAVYIDRVSNNEVIFGLRDSKENPLPIMIEEGTGAWDEKEGFSQSNKAKTKIGGGWYLSIPFKHATPKSLGESSAFSSVMPREVYNIAKKASNPLKLKDLPEEYRVKGITPGYEVRGVKKEIYQHKSAEYEGLQRRDISSGKEKRGEYMTFRRVSDKSDPNSWIHPGFEAKKFMDRAIDSPSIDTVVDRTVDDFLSER